MSKCVALGLALASVMACGSSEEAPTTSASGTGGAGASVGPTTTTTGGGGDDPSGSGGAGAGGGDGYTYSPPALAGSVYAGHFLGDNELVGYTTDTLTSVGAAIEPGGPTSGLLGIAKHGILAVGIEGGTTMEAYDAATGAAIPGSPYATGNAPVDLAHDDRRDLLFVYCIGTIGDPSRSELSVYDTSSVPFVEVAGSPFDIDVAANQIDVDPVTGNVYGASLLGYWAVAYDGSGVTHLSGSPRTFDGGFGADLVVDPERRRLYVGERVTGATQRVLALDADTFTPLAESPLSLPGSSLGDMVINPRTGDVWAVDFGDTTLHSIQAEPLMVRNTCGSMGCPILTTETGLALDYDRDRLFIAHVPDLNQPDSGPGFFTAWDVSDAANPAEVTMPGQRLGLELYPVTASSL
ncbi:MAG: hypothetical protein AAF715_12055 [Myxococcota bacterium]